MHIFTSKLNMSNSCSAKSGDQRKIANLEECIAQSIFHSIQKLLFFLHFNTQS